MTPISETYRALIASDRVGAKTRAALLNRGKSDDPAYYPAALSMMSLSILRIVIDRILPQQDFIDIAARIDAQLESGTGDGWRRAELPPDTMAYTAGLLTLNDQAKAQYGQYLTQLPAAQQDELLSSISAGLCSASQNAQGRLNARQMQLWFADLRADAVRTYMSHPATLDKIGYSGIANGNDGQPKTGFVRIGAGETEDWEPQAHPKDAP